MSEFLRALELVLDELPRLLTPEEWEGLQAELLPLVERYRATDDPALVQPILAVLRRYPKVAGLLPEARYRPPTAPPPSGQQFDFQAGAAEFDRPAREIKGPPRRTARAAPPAPAPPPSATPPPPPPPSPHAEPAAAPRPAPSPQMAPRPAPRPGAPKRKNGGGGGGRGVGAGLGPMRGAAAPRGTGRGRAADRPKSGSSKVDQSAPRWILARVFDLSRGRRTQSTARAYRAGVEHEVEVMIGIEDPEWLIARGPSARDSLDNILPTGTHELEVAFIIPALGIHQMGKLTLPPTGPTPVPAIFRFTAPPANTPVEALINVIYRNRILQTAILSGVAVADPATAPTDAQLKLRLQIVVPGFGDLERREPFDAALLVTRHPDGRAMGAAVPKAAAAESPIVLFDQPGLDGALAGLRDVLDKFLADPTVFEERLDSDASVSLMRSLAKVGVVLHRAIGLKLKQTLAGRDLERLQVVQVDPTAFIPVEFVYDLPAPANNAGLCENWREALKGVPCAPQHHQTDELDDLKVVCPSGFWSISKVIERQVVKEVEAADLKGSRFGIRAEPTALRSQLAAPSGALFAWSEILDNTIPGSSDRMLKSLKTTAGKATPVKTWRDWATKIRELRPPLLVLLSHTTDDEPPPSLEIGPDGAGRPQLAERRALGQVNQRLVKTSPQEAPVLFLLGCDTAVADRQLYSFVAGFREAGAAVVIGTITPVHGELSAAVVETLVKQLAAAAKQKGEGVRFGDLMRAGRRRLLSEGKLTALSVASFGDADWLVGGKGA